MKNHWYVVNHQIKRILRFCHPPPAYLPHLQVLFCFHFVTICMQLLIHYRIRDVTTDPRIWYLLGKPDFGGGNMLDSAWALLKNSIFLPLLSKVPNSTFQERSEHKHIGVVPPLEIDSCLSPEKVNRPKSILYREKGRIWKWMLLFNLQQTSWNGAVISCCPAH